MDFTDLIGKALGAYSQIETQKQALRLQESQNQATQLQTEQYMALQQAQRAEAEANKAPAWMLPAVGLVLVGAVVWMVGALMWAALASSLGSAIAAPDTGANTSQTGQTSLGGNITFGAGGGLPAWVAPAAMAAGVLVLVLLLKNGGRK